MPKFLEQRLEVEGRKKGFTGRKLAHYVWGAMNNIGAVKGNKITSKGRAMQKKHNEDRR